MPHVIYLAIGFPPAAKSCAHRMKATANLLCEQGCAVTVITIARDSWKHENGIDVTLSDGVDPRVEVVELPLRRKDVDPSIHTYGWFRARHPKRWRRWRRWLDQLAFPEPVFGGWRPTVERAVLDVHDARPADLLLVSTVPYVGLSAAWKLRRVRGVPYAIDFRDAWSLDVIGGGVAFPVRSRRGRWEKKLVENSARVWCVNESIREHYAQRYHQIADRLLVVRNGSDLPPAPHVGRPDPAAGLTFGYLGTAIFSVPYLRAVLEGWRTARQVDPVLARSRLEFRGYFGWQSADMADGRRALLARFAQDGVIFGGPVARAEAAAIYAGWDALLLLLTGGRYTTSGKVYEYMSTGLPIMSAHGTDHGAFEVLDGYPLWSPPPRDMTAELLADSFVATAEMVLSARDEQRAAALAHGARYERRAQMAPAVRDLVDSIAAARADQAERRSGASSTTSISA
jgi:glycosyltransferase involved in cell wall biosynthesis